jgi:hypothetical protein
MFRGAVGEDHAVLWEADGVDDGALHAAAAPLRRGLRCTLISRTSASTKPAKADHADAAEVFRRMGRRYTAECLTLARQTSDSPVRTSLLEMAQKRLDPAELSEHGAWKRRSAKSSARGMSPHKS